MNFADSLKDEVKWAMTENGEVCKTTTDNPLLDLFATIGALRSRSEDEIVNKFILAYNFDPLHTVRCVFYARDIRGGLGERNTFRILIHFMGNYCPSTLLKNFEFIKEMGRWDDFYSLIGTKVEDQMWEYISNQLNLDICNYEQNKPISLLAKWLKKADSTSGNTKRLGIYTAKRLYMPIYKYKRLSNKLRKHIGVVEQKMSSNEWCDIDYSKVPSKAMMNYRNAFCRHDQEGFTNFIGKVKSGENKINSSTLYPYEIIEKMLQPDQKEYEVLEEQWKALPNYIDGEFNVLVMADVSGSMSGRPLYSSIGLALYFAQRNIGKYHNLFMTFSENPQIVELADVSFANQIRMINQSDWGLNTNLYKALEYILKIAIENNCKNHELPKALLVVTDMEIDSAVEIDESDRCTSATRIRKRFEQYGYSCPKIVIWNVDSRHDTFLADKNDVNTLLVSGQSPSIFRQVMKCLDKTPEQMMIATLDSDRYKYIDA